jgi:hypothetical protein
VSNIPGILGIIHLKLGTVNKQGCRSLADNIAQTATSSQSPKPNLLVGSRDIRSTR